MSRRWRKRRTVEQAIGKALVDLGRQQRTRPAAGLAEPMARPFPDIRTQAIAAGIITPAVPPEDETA